MDDCKLLAFVAARLAWLIQKRFCSEPGVYRAARFVYARDFSNNARVASKITL